LHLYLSRSRSPVSDREEIEKRIARLRQKVRRKRQQLISAPPHMTAEARVFFNRAMQMFKQARYRDALAAFLAAQRLVPAPEIQYNLALTSEKLGRAGDAIDYYRAYLRSLDDPAQKRAIQEKIRELQKN
jgi:tetratricopeptide (TPR) repeat protein